MNKTPPMIILLDVLFIFLFILILQPEEPIYMIKLPENINPPQTVVVAQNKYNRSVYYYNKFTNKWESYSKFKIELPNYIKKTIYENSLMVLKHRNYYDKLPKLKENNLNLVTLIYSNTASNIYRELFLKCTQKKSVVVM